MDIFGIGLPEIIFILLLVVIIFGPKDLEKMGKTIGGALFHFFNSEAFRNLRRIGELPAELARKAGLEEFRATVNSTKKPNPQNPPADQVLTPAFTNPEGTETENRIQPPPPGGDKPV
ncbi:MAG: twin-arginine translocase TatA/TatE family subunit [Chloroflexi bacterium]|nr:twin-arginine translocase TatA/TatE family subunit [Chloroflexota bacterium]